MRLAVLVGLFCLVLVSGCKEEGPTRYRVSGDATFGANPITHGVVLFTPDDSKQNSGPQGLAQIRDGKFDTSSSDGKGIAGGPTVVHVTVLTGAGGQVICEYEYKVDLPRSDTKHNVEVPATAAPKKKGSTSEI
jgi:hypothetical protein